MTDKKGSASTDVDSHVLHKEWDEILCPICMDHPHNAVLLLCGSHEKGCSSYICDTSYRHSNCLDRFKKLRVNLRNSPHSSSSFVGTSESERHGQRSLHSHTSESILGEPRMSRNLVDDYGDHNLEESNNGISAATSDTLEETNRQEPDRYSESQGEERMDLQESGGGNMSETNGILSCPLCRGMVIGWRIVREAREYLDLKSRSCSRESCAFSGNYRELRRHARRVHPTTRPADVDPSRQRAWHHLEHQRETGDIVSALRSMMPGAIVFGDYVIENGDGPGLLHNLESSGSGEGSRSWLATFLLFQMIGSPLSSLDDRSSLRTWRTHRRSRHRNLWGENLLGLQDYDDDDDGLESDEVPVPRRRRRFTRSRSAEGNHER